MIGNYALALSSLWFGGVIKGATGVGAPFVAVPVITALFDIRMAIVALVVPNLVTNTWQFWQYRRKIEWRGFIVPFVAGGTVGVLLGTWLLTTLPTQVLTACVAVAVYGYIILRIIKADWVLAQNIGRRLSFPIGAASGALQGSIGISAPISMTYLNAMRLDRTVFMGSMSLLFLTFGIIQFPLLVWVGVMTSEGLLLSLCAVVALSSGMPVGALLVSRINPATFDKIILILLALVATSLLWQSL